MSMSIILTYSYGITCNTKIRLILSILVHKNILKKTLGLWESIFLLCTSQKKKKPIREEELNFMFVSNHVSSAPFVL